MSKFVPVYPQQDRRHETTANRQVYQFQLQYSNTNKKADC